MARASGSRRRRSGIALRPADPSATSCRRRLSATSPIISCTPATPVPDAPQPEDRSPVTDPAPPPIAEETPPPAGPPPPGPAGLPRGPGAVAKAREAAADADRAPLDVGLHR